MTDAGLTDGELEVLKKLLEPEQLARFQAVAEHGELLLSEAQRLHERRRLRGGFKASVRKNNWTPEQARLNGLLNSLRSTMRRYDQVRGMDAPRPADIESVEADLAMMRRKLADFQAEMAAAGRTVTLDRDSSVVDITELAPDVG